MVKKSHLNTLLDITTMMTLDHYVTSFLKIIGYAKYVHNNKTIFLKIIDKKLLKKYMKICEKTGSLTKKNFDIQPVNGDSDKYIQTKIKSIEIK